MELVIFDCDGVLIDSEVLSMQAWQALLSSFDIALSKQYFIEHFLGKSMEHVQGKLKDDFALTLTTSMKNKFHGFTPCEPVQHGCREICTLESDPRVAFFFCISR